MRRPVATAIRQVKYLLGFSKAHHERMVTPLAFVTDGDSLLLLTCGFDHGSIGLDRGLVEETVFLLLPNFLAGAIDGLHDLQDRVRIESSAKVSGGGWVRNSRCANRIEISFVVASVLKMFQARSAAE